jgi:hypothetical protein
MKQRPAHGRAGAPRLVVVRHEVVVPQRIDVAMPRDKDHHVVARLYLLGEPIEGLFDVLTGGLRVGERSRLDAGEQLSLVSLEGGGQIASVLGRMPQIVPGRLVSTHADGQHDEVRRNLVRRLCRDGRSETGHHQERDHRNTAKRIHVAPQNLLIGRAFQMPCSPGKSSAPVPADKKQPGRLGKSKWGRST